jgi:hypothetical protein
VTRKIKEQKQRQEAIKKFIREIFKAIQFLNAEESKANVTQVNRYFERNEIPKSGEYGLSLGTPYLKSLVSEGYLKTEDKKVKNRTFTVYLLTEKAIEDLSPKKDKPEETRTIEEEEVSPKKEAIVQELKEKQELEQEEIYDSVELIKCPKCGYYCQKDINECPTCNIILKTEPTEEKLIECPNPKCDYTCRSTWDECPICHTKLIPTKRAIISRKVSKKEKPLKKQPSQKISISKESNKYCVSCGKSLKSTSKAISSQDLICVKCQDDLTTEKDRIKFCPSCGKRTIPKKKFCINCYRSFCRPSEKYKDKSLDELYDLSVKYNTNYQFLQIFAIQFVLIALLIANLMLDFNIADEIEYDIYDYFIPALFFAPIFLYNLIKYYQIRKERIARDPHYRIKLGIVHYKRDKAVEVVKEKFNIYRKKYIHELRQIKDFYDKIDAINRRRAFYRIIFIILVATGFVLMFLVYTFFLIFLIVGLFFLYLYIRKKRIQYIDDMIRLGKYLAEEEFKIFVFLVIRQLYYLQAIKERDRKR